METIHWIILLGIFVGGGLAWHLFRTARELGDFFDDYDNLP